MGCIAAIARFLIVLINLMFMIIGFILAAVGAMVKFVPNNPLLDKYEDQAKASMKDILSGSGKSTDSIDNFSISDITGNLALGILILGGVILIFFFFGFVGAICKLRKVLMIYSVIIGILLLIQVCLVIIVCADISVIKDSLSEPLTSSLKKDYTGIEGTNVLDLGWNFIMIKFKCCGVLDYMDFDDALSWVTDVTTTKGSYTLKMPVACCASAPTDGDYTCATTRSGNAENGCLTAVWDAAFGDKVNFLTFALPIILFQLLIIMGSVLIFKSEGTHNAVADKDTKEQEIRNKQRKMKRFTVIEPDTTATKTKNQW